jgi:fimbrial chaperone protein
MRHAIRLCLGLLLSAAASNLAAFTFQPMFVRLDSAGQGSVQTFEVRNEGAESLAVRFSVLSRTVGPAGVELNEDASDLFTIYPSRVVVEPRSSASMKLQWNGPSSVPSELAFRLVAENIPIDSAPSVSSGIKVMFRYVASVYVGEASFVPQLMWSVKGAIGSTGKKGFTVEIVNKGKRHVVAESTLLTIKGIQGLSGGALALGKDDLGSLYGANYLPELPLRLFIPRAEAVPGKVYDAQFTFEPEF